MVYYKRRSARLRSGKRFRWLRRVRRPRYKRRSFKRRMRKGSLRYLRKYGYKIREVRGPKVVCLKYTWAGPEVLAIGARFSDYAVLSPTNIGDICMATGGVWDASAGSYERYAQHYARYQVKSVKATIGMTLRHAPSDVPTEPMTNASFGLSTYVAGAYFENAPGVAQEVPPSNASWVTLAARGGCRYLQQSAGMNIKKMKLNWARKNVFGAGYRDEWMPIGTPPTNPMRLHLFTAKRDGVAVPEGPADPPVIDFIVRLKIYVAFQGATTPETDGLVQVANLT